MPDTSRRLYLTHASPQKNESLRGTGVAVAPVDLYRGPHAVRFMRVCAERGVRWAILSPLYGVWFPEERHAWYGAQPKKLGDAAFAGFVARVDEALAPFDDIRYYMKTGALPPLPRRWLKASTLQMRVTLFSHLDEIR